MEKLLDLLKIFEEKHLIPVMASIAVAILFVTFLPNLFDLTNKAGKVLYLILVFCIAFLLIHFGKYICSFFKNKIAKKRKQKKIAEFQQKEEEEHEKEMMEILWDYVDSLSPQDQCYLMEFLKTNNKPIEMREIAPNGLLSDSDNVACTEKKQASALDPSRKIEFEGDSMCIPNGISFMEDEPPVKLYRLKDDFFNLLKCSYEKYHKISHFEMEEVQNGQPENASSKQG